MTMQPPEAGATSVGDASRRADGLEVLELLLGPPRVTARTAGDVYEMVPWARAGSPYTCDFDDLTAWLAQQMSQTQVTRSPGSTAVAADTRSGNATRLDRDPCGPPSPVREMPPG
jgi:hypothetical protein